METLYFIKPTKKYSIPSICYCFKDRNSIPAMILENMRQEIDDIDKDIILLISKRIRIAKKIANYKKENKIPIIDKKREDFVISEFEREFVLLGMKKETGRILARSLIDSAIVEEKNIVE